METQIILGNPPSKSNCYRIVSAGGRFTLAKTQTLKKYEDDFYIQCDKYRNANITGYFRLHAKVFYPSQRSDLDNALKCLLDCLQRVKAFPNDNKCTGLSIEKFLDKQNPRIEFYIEPI